MSAIKTTLIVTGAVLVVAGVGTLGYMYYSERSERKQLANDLETALKQFEEVDAQIASLKQYKEAGSVLVDDQNPAAVGLFDDILAKHVARAEAKMKATAEEAPLVKAGTVHYMKPEFVPVHENKNATQRESVEAPGVSKYDMVRALVNSVIANQLVSVGMAEASAQALMDRHSQAVQELAKAIADSEEDLTTTELLSAAVEKHFRELQETNQVFRAFVEEVGTTAAMLKAQAANG